MAQGYFEISTGLVTGWVCDERGSAEVTLFVAGQPVGKTVAHEHRPDVELAGIGGAYCGFTFLLQDGSDLTDLIRLVSVRAALPGGDHFDVPPANGILEAREALRANQSSTNEDAARLLNEKQKVAQGQGDWLFLVNDRNRAWDQIAGNVPVTDTSVNAWRTLFKTRRMVCESAGALFLPAIIPDKYVIHGQLALPACQASPSRLGCRIAENSQVAYLDERLHEVTACGLTSHFRQDTHWSDFACLDVAWWIRSQLPGGVTNEFETVAYDLMGDLGEKLDDPVPEAVIGIRPAVQRAVLTSRQFLESGVEMREYQSEACGHLLLVGTSATSQIEGFLAEMFGRTTVCVSSGFPIELIDKIKPDLVVNLVTERTMVEVPNDYLFGQGVSDQCTSRFERYLNRWAAALPVSLLLNNQ